jgi:hypothetical protein
LELLERNIRRAVLHVIPVREARDQPVIGEEQPELTCQGHAALGLMTELLQLDKLPKDETPSQISALELEESMNDPLDGIMFCRGWDEARRFPLMFAGLDEVLEHHRSGPEDAQDFHDTLARY